MCLYCIPSAGTSPIAYKLTSCPVLDFETKRRLMCIKVSVLQQESKN